MASDSPEDETGLVAASRVRSEIQGTAQREADQIIRKAREDIRAIVSDAYAELLILKAQVQAMSNETSGQPLEGLDAEAQTLRRQLGHSGVADTVRGRPQLTEPTALPATAPLATPPPPRPQASGLSITATPEREEPYGYVPPPYKERSRRQAPKALVVTGVIAVIAIGGFVWWSQRGSAPVSPGVVESAQSSAPAASEAPPPPAAAPTPTAAAPAAAPVFAPGTVTVRLTARRMVWVRADVDGQVDSGILMNEGQMRDLGPARFVELRVGDAGALSIAVNGADQGVLGQDGIVVTRRYGEPAPEPPPPPVVVPQ